MLSKVVYKSVLVVVNASYVEDCWSCQEALLSCRYGRGLAVGYGASQALAVE
jgi:hypothetical protein